MKRIVFIRHSNLVNSHSNYSQLTLEQLSMLATGRTTPDIHGDSLKLIRKKYSGTFLNSFDLILCSISNRSQQTAILFQQLNTKKIKIQTNNNLHEITFDPLLLTTERRYKKYGMNEIRRSLFKEMKKEQCAESMQEAFQRIKSLDEGLQKINADTILCISHSFFMRLLRLYFLENIHDHKKVTIKKLMNTIDHLYLEGFEINL